MNNWLAGLMGVGVVGVIIIIGCAASITMVWLFGVNGLGVLSALGCLGGGAWLGIETWGRK